MGHKTPSPIVVAEGGEGEERNGRNGGGKKKKGRGSLKF